MRIRSSSVIVVAVGLAVMVAGTCALLLTRHGPAARRPVSVAVAAAPSPTSPIVAPPESAPPRPPGRPVSLAIPVIGVHTRLITLGRTSGGSLQVPATTSVAGWYTGSPRPGAVGSAIIVGHIDSYRGPGVFFRLSGLHPGNQVYVRQAGGTVVRFRVTEVQRYLKSHFPTQAVYGPTPDPELRLITCGGAFDAATGHYLSNIVIYATEGS